MKREYWRPFVFYFVLFFAVVVGSNVRRQSSSDNQAIYIHSLFSAGMMIAFFLMGSPTLKIMVSVFIWTTHSDYTANYPNSIWFVFVQIAGKGHVLSGTVNNPGETLTFWKLPLKKKIHIVLLSSTFNGFTFSVLIFFSFISTDANFLLNSVVIQMAIEKSWHPVLSTAALLHHMVRRTALCWKLAPKNVIFKPECDASTVFWNTWNSHHFWRWHHLSSKSGCNSHVLYMCLCNIFM